MLHKLIFLALMSFQPSKLDHETVEERSARMLMIDESVMTATAELTCTDAPEGCVRKWPLSRKQLAFLMIMTSRKESDVSRHIHEGHCRRFECDPIRVVTPVTGKVEIKFRAAGIWQLHQSNLFTEELWQQAQTATPEGTLIAARQAAKLFANGYYACKSIEGSIAHYATGGSCTWKHAAERAQLFQQLHDSSEQDFVRRAQKIWGSVAYEPALVM